MKNCSQFKLFDKISIYFVKNNAENTICGNNYFLDYIIDYFGMIEFILTFRQAILLLMALKESRTIEKRIMTSTSGIICFVHQYVY